MIPHSEYRIYPLGDSALTIDLGNMIEPSLNRKVLRLFDHLVKNPLPGMIEAVPAYSSLSIYYDVVAVQKKTSGYNAVFDYMKAQLEKSLPGITGELEETSPRLMNVPVCYDPALAPGIKELAQTKSISLPGIIELHTSKMYRIYMLGFLPGFAYMGEVDDRISMPRKTQPEMVAAGSVGIAGKQTGIYPFNSPGGWCIIGRTPLQLFNETIEGYTLLRAGDIVQFTSISKDEFENYQGGHS